MHRNTLLVLAAGVAGALSTAVAGHMFLTPAWAQNGQPTQAGEPATATVDVLGLLERLLETEEYATERDSERQVWAEQTQTLQSEAQMLLQSLQQLDPQQAESPEAQNLYAQYQSAVQRFNQLQQQQGMAMDRLAARQLTDAYQRIHTTVEQVASERGFARVFSSRMTADEIDASSTNAVVQEVLIRPVLFDVASVDLTPDVREALGLPEQAEEPAAPAVEGLLEGQGVDGPDPAGGQDAENGG